ncbi:MAG: nucleotidyltransferase domain-containing protein [Anaerolineales bacterium]|nr:nucleotidyltransferase domain-containing protein [Anaerolineales bacterium]MBX3038073.1 nucleotidyltransferase domain-containing protein [Anaerolineales bacterium]
MAKTTSNVKKIVRKYRAQLIKMGVQPSRILLYGSQATGKAVEGSDIDLIVISNTWSKYSQRKRLELLGIASARILEPVQAQGFTPSEIKSKKLTSFWEQVIKEQAVAV